MKQLPTEPTQEWCGSPGKIGILTLRAALHLPLFVEGDCLKKIAISRDHQSHRGSRRETLANLLAAMARPRHPAG
jgi:hypothetical protein